MPHEIKLRILLQDPIDGLFYGLQKGKGSDSETVQAQPGQGSDLQFDFAVGLKPAKGSAPLLTGPFVQGTPGNRFVYLNIGCYAGQPGAPWSGRLKVPLSEAQFQDALTAGNEDYWQCTVPGRTKDGKPVFATVKPFSGWAASKLSGEAGT